MTELENSRMVQIRNLIVCWLENDRIDDSEKLAEIKYMRNRGFITDDEGVDLALYYNLHK